MINEIFRAKLVSLIDVVPGVHPNRQSLRLHGRQQGVAKRR
ncbi:hypothetical protein [Pseudomonas argentinensis]|nr:hypothetical protein [Pseudomonas argentinensis]